MTSSPTREEVEAVLVALDEATKEGAGPLAPRCEDMLRALLARAEAAERERDALRDEWEEIAAGITTEIPEVGALWPMVSEINGSLCAVRKIFRNEVEAHNRTEAERDAARAEAARLRRALKPFAARVFNDNGDMTVSGTHLVPTEAFCDAYLALRAALAGEAGRD